MSKRRHLVVTSYTCVVELTLLIFLHLQIFMSIFSMPCKRLLSVSPDTLVFLRSFSVAPASEAMKKRGAASTLVGKESTDIISCICYNITPDLV